MPFNEHITASYSDNVCLLNCTGNNCCPGNNIPYCTHNCSLNMLENVSLTARVVPLQRRTFRLDLNADDGLHWHLSARYRDRMRWQIDVLQHTERALVGHERAAAAVRRCAAPFATVACPHRKTK